MSKELLFVQCELLKSGYHDRYKHSWIPEQFAKIGNTIKLRKEERQWEDGWCVINVFSGIKKTEKEANIDAEAWKHQRECSDI